VTTSPAISYDDRPWLARYTPDQRPDIDVEFGDALAMVRATVAARADDPALKYFDGVLTWRELDELSTALAAGLQASGFSRGDRLAVYLQNVPQFVIAMLATWKAGGIMVSVNPMNRERELRYQLQDSGARVLVCLESLYESVARSVVPDTDVQLVLTTSETEYQSRSDQRLFTGTTKSTPEGTVDFAQLAEQHRGAPVPDVSYGVDDVAFLTYTSGTTGVPKGAMNTHGNVCFTAQVYRDYAGVGTRGSVLGVAPLFHITGLIGHIGVCLLSGSPLILAYRFEPQVVLDAIREHRPTFTIGSITVFIALMNAPGFAREDFASFEWIYSGGAPIAPSTAEAFEKATGLPIHNAYGLTETTSPMTLTPRGTASPVDQTSGAFSVGVPVNNTVVRVLDEEGNPVPLGDVGEICCAGPQVVLGYWNKPEETAQTLPGRELRSGDVGFMTPEGWIFIVDRKKDMINAAGYKVWPREVEDVLYGHPAVREAAVVGVPDEYRGETVKAFVSLKPGAEATPEELIAFCKERMAAYKYPRQVEMVEELPKTVTGKILRRELRNQAAPAQ
jgi:long-chain acyl-CoA synthetase